ncbi:envelope stress response membrane protein PspB [Solimonas marina]|uniref:Envelope stress response membrane protein PspB n=1 Tax=Solimonas marina TaxID=2714601 RepID=A0A969WAK8_9GAMM|nr:envelope stress response membrane protein PspB [Solimonas marina]
METFLDNLIPLIAVTGIFVVFPVLLFRHLAHRRDTQQPVGTVNQDLVDLADRMEKRIDTLERLLDVEAPGWREKHHEHR